MVEGLHNALGVRLSTYTYRISCTAYALTQACPAMTLYFTASASFDFHIRKELNTGFDLVFLQLCISGDAVMDSVAHLIIVSAAYVHNYVFTSDCSLFLLQLKRSWVSLLVQSWALLLLLQSSQLQLSCCAL